MELRRLPRALHITADLTMLPQAPKHRMPLTYCVANQAALLPARKPWQPPVEGSPIPRSTEEDLDFSFGPASAAARPAKVIERLLFAALRTAVTDI